MTTIYAGFDCFRYPGDDIMRALLAETNLTWSGFYLSAGWCPANNPSVNYNTMKTMGWGVAPIFWGEQPDSTNGVLQTIKMQHRGHPNELKQALYNAGIADGMKTVGLAAAAQIRPQTVIYFDRDNPTPDDLDWFEYYKGWSRYLHDHGFQVGLYARTKNAAMLVMDLMTMQGFDQIMPEIWIVDYTKVNPNGSRPPDSDFLRSPLPTPDPRTKYAGATTWQHMGNHGIKWGSNKTFWPFDYSSSVYRDPGLGFLGTLAPS